MENEEIVDDKQSDDKSKPEDISLKEGIQSVNHYGQKEEEMEKGKNPVKHDTLTERKPMTSVC